MADVYERYSQAERNLVLARNRASEGAAEVQRLTSNMAYGREGGETRNKVSALQAQFSGGVSRAQADLDALRPELDQTNSRLASANAQITATVTGTNQRAAISGQAQEAESSDGTADLLIPENADTATPGGASGRRRRKSEEVGSIRI